MLIGSISVFTLVIVAGSLYGLFHSLFMTLTLKDWKAFPLFFWKLFDGVFIGLGKILMNVAIGYDVLANVIGGEMVEDLTTFEEQTTFGDPITLSASVGEIEIREKDSLTVSGKRLSRVLNIVFNQRSHALDSWEIHLKRKQLNNQFFKPRKK